MSTGDFTLYVQCRKVNIHIFLMDNWILSYSDDSIVRKAYMLAEKAHEGTQRASGEPYISHPLAVAKTIHEWRLDETSIAAALLHDVVEDTSISIRDIEKEFGEEVSQIVDGVTKLKRFQYGENPDAENIRKLILSFSKDLRVILIKLADRFHNMQTLQYKDPDKQREIAWETIEIYAPIAYRLGMQKLSGDLEDIAFPYLYPDEYSWLMKNVHERYEERVLYVEKLKPAVLEILRDAEITPISVDLRAKRHYSLYRKLLRSDMNIENIYDLVALRIVVNTVEECYATLGMIHKFWSPLQGRFKDYIAVPKPNGYRSLHTTVSAIDSKITEVQIRTKEMHEEAEFGIAAHWAYEQIKKNPDKKKEGWGGVKNKKELLWIEQLHNWQKSFANQQDFLDSLKVDFFKERIFVVTPKNDVIDLPAGSTPVDFAYHIHTEIGDQCVGARINGKIVPIDYELQSGDCVEILTQKGKKPSEDWLRFLKSSIARKYVRSFVRGKDKKLQKTITPQFVEFKIINMDRSGYLKEITGIFADMKVNIIFLNSQTDPRSAFSAVNVRCPYISKEKIQKILVNVKSVSGTKEISYRYIR